MHVCQGSCKVSCKDVTRSRKACYTLGTNFLREKEHVIFGQWDGLRENGYESNAT